MMTGGEIATILAVVAPVGAVVAGYLQWRIDRSVGQTVTKLREEIDEDFMTREVLELRFKSMSDHLDRVDRHLDRVDKHMTSVGRMIEKVESRPIVDRMQAMNLRLDMIDRKLAELSEEGERA